VGGGGEPVLADGVPGGGGGRGGWGFGGGGWGVLGVEVGRG